MNVSHEIDLLVEEIKRLGSKSKSMSRFCALAAGICLNTGCALNVTNLPQIY